MSLGFKQSAKNRTWTQIMVEESEISLRARKTSRNLTFRRMYLSVFVSFGAAFLVYCSLFYVGAFVDVGKVIGVSQSDRALKVKMSVTDIQLPARRVPVISPLQDAFSVNRVYLRKGQAIQATYTMPPGTKLTLKIKQCEQLPVVEVFKCRFAGVKELHIDGNSAGSKTFRVNQPGFYYFDDQVVRLPGTELKANHDYKVIWLRG